MEFRFFWDLKHTLISKLTFTEFTDLVSKINFAPTSENEVKQLLSEYIQLHKFACETTVDHRAQNSVSEYIPNMLKQFVLKYKETAPIMYKFLSYVVSFPTSVVESWGSSIDHLNKNKPNTTEGL